MIIKIENLVHKYKTGVTALDNLNLKVKEGEIFTLLGPNGAGKSTLIDILTTYCRPSSGKVKMLNKDLSKNTSWIRSQIACVTQNMSIDLHLSLIENMIFQSKLYKIDKKTSKKRMDYLIDIFELSDYLNFPTSSYSGGIKRRLDIAMNMISSPKILFLDEPTAGMDVESRKILWKMLIKICSDYKTTIFLTTHYLEEAEQLSTTICIINKGKNIIQETPENLCQCLKQDIIKIEFSDSTNLNKYKSIIKKTMLFKNTKIKGNIIFENVENGKETLIKINKYLLDNSFEFNSIGLIKPSLEDVFLSLTSSTMKEKLT